MKFKIYRAWHIPTRQWLWKVEDPYDSVHKWLYPTWQDAINTVYWRLKLQQWRGER